MDDVKLWREHGRPMCNIPTPIKHHSPDGIEWGYGGSGPADLALNLLHEYLGTVDEPRETELWDGSKVSVMTDMLHQRFKETFLSRMPVDGGRIKVADIDYWFEGSTDEYVFCSYCDARVLSDDSTEYENEVCCESCRDELEADG
jgi:hypothetical protein